MRKYALLRDNVVVDIKNLESSDLEQVIPTCQQIIDVEDATIPPQVGWVLDGNCLKAGQTPSPSARLALIMDMRFKFGNKLADEMVKKMSIRNLALIAAGQTLNINTVIVTFSGIESAMRKCAIPTAKSGILAMSSSYPEYTEEFTYAISEIDNYLAIEATV